MFMTTDVQKYLDQSEKGYWKYGSIYISLTNVCTFLSILLTIRWYFMDKDNVVC